MSYRRRQITRKNRQPKSLTRGAKKLLEEMGIASIPNIKGSGKNGNVTKADVTAWLDSLHQDEEE